MSIWEYIDPSGNFVFYVFYVFCIARTFWDERHLDVVLEVLQVVGSKFVDKYNRKIHRKNYDECFINDGDIYLFELLTKKKKKNIQKFPKLNGHLKICFSVNP